MYICYNNFMVMYVRKHIITVIKSFLAGALCAVLAAGLLAGCRASDEGAGSGGADGEKLRVLAAIYPLYDFARAVSGGKADVSMLIAPGANIHSFDPSPADIKNIGSANLFLYIGGESDAWTDGLLASMEGGGPIALRLLDAVNALPEEVTEEMTPEEEEAEEADADEEEGEADEHIWTAPKNAAAIVAAIETAMADADPKNAESYRENAARYIDELNKLDAEFSEVCEKAERRTIVVADRYPFLYFSRAYGLNYVAAFPGCSDQTDAGAQTIVALIEAVRAESLPYIYHVELSNQRVAQSVCETTGAKALELHSCENVTKEDFSSGVTYMDLMRRNLDNLKLGLGVS